MNRPPEQPSWDGLHYRLVSLWDLLMHRIATEKLIDGFQVMAKLAQELQGKIQFAASFQGMPIPTGFEFVLSSLAALRDEADMLGLDVVSANAKKALEVLNGRANETHLSAAEARNFHRLIEIAQVALRDQLENRIVLAIPLSQSKLYDPSDPLFGKKVHTKFKKKARHEISEAAKCLALDRPTACVFHLMRTVEVGLEAVRSCLGVPPPTKGQHKAWGAAIQAINSEIEGRESLAWPRQWLSLSDKKFFEEIVMALIGIKDGCRDDTMHVESVYTVDEADHLFALTKGFMQKVASRLDEDGQPLAWPPS